MRQKAVHNRIERLNNMERDPVCGMMVDPKTSKKSEYRGKTYYFCSAGCMKDFDKNPEKYINNAEEDKKKAA